MHFYVIIDFLRNLSILHKYNIYNNNFFINNYLSIYKFFCFIVINIIININNAFLLSQYYQFYNSAISNHQKAGIRSSMNEFIDTIRRMH